MSPVPNVRLTLVAAAFALVALADAAAAQQDATATLSHQGRERRFVLHTPPGPAMARPLVMVLHGRGQPLSEVRDWLPLEPIADREGFAVAYPEAIDGQWDYLGETDLGFLDALADRLVSRGVADAAQIFVAGISRGALMTYTLVCRRPERFAAAAALSSGMNEAQLAGCAPAELLPLMVVAGTRDSVQRYDGWLAPPAPRLMSIPETMEFWRRRHGCSGQTLDYGIRRFIERIDWTGCTSPLVLWRVIDGEHEPPARARGQEIDASEEVWRFFRGR